MLEPELRERICGLVGGTASSFVRVRGGYSAAARWTFRANRQTYFAKIATTKHTCKQLHQEIAAYDKIHGDFMPIRIASEQHESAPILILEDLSNFYWPPPWRAGQIDAVLGQIAGVHELTADLPTYADVYREEGLNWPVIAEDKERFLSLGLVSERWLEHALPSLLEAESKCVTVGCALTHWDIRSDNICIRDQSIKLIDWDNACLGNPKFDLGFWLPSLAHEGGPDPESVLGDEPEVAACVSGYFAARAGLPKIENAPGVRVVQRQQLVPALSWAMRALDLPALN